MFAMFSTVLKFVLTEAAVKINVALIHILLSGKIFKKKKRKNSANIYSVKLNLLTNFL